MDYCCVLQSQENIMVWWTKQCSLTKHNKMRWMNKIKLLSVNSSCSGTTTHILLQGRGSITNTCLFAPTQSEQKKAKLLYE